MKIQNSIVQNNNNSTLALSLCFIVLVHIIQVFNFISTFQRKDIAIVTLYIYMYILLFNIVHVPRYKMIKIKSIEISYSPLLYNHKNLLG